MAERREDEPGDARAGSELPRSVGAPARRALEAAGYTRLDQLAGLDPAQLERLHGVGPKAVRVIADALDARRRAERSGDHAGGPPEERARS